MEYIRDHCGYGLSQCEALYYRLHMNNLHVFICEWNQPCFQCHVRIFCIKYLTFAAYLSKSSTWMSVAVKRILQVTFSYISAYSINELLAVTILRIVQHYCVCLWILSYLGAVSIRKTVLPGMAIPMLKIRRPNGRLIFNMEITIRR